MNILIVSFKLGLKSGVGGRRWLYYGLELLKRNNNVFFISYEENIPQELTNHKDRVHLLKNNYPKILKTVPASLV